MLIAKYGARRAFSLNNLRLSDCAQNASLHSFFAPNVVLIAAATIEAGMTLWTADSDFKRVQTAGDLRVDWYGVEWRST